MTVEPSYQLCRARFETRSTSSNQKRAAFEELRVPAPIKALSLPSTSLKTSISPAHGSDAAKNSTETGQALLPTRGSVLNVMQLVASNPAVLAGIGSTIVTISISPIVSALCFLITVCTARNTIRSSRSPENSPGNDETARPRRQGLGGLIQEVRHAPGLFSVFQSLVYAGASLQLFFRGELGGGLIFSIFAVGAAAIARISNQGTLHPPRERTYLEKVVASINEKIPESVSRILGNPGILFPAANLALIVRDSNMARIFEQPLTSGLFVTGALLCTLAVASGIQSAFRRESLVKSLSRSPILAGMGDILFGSASSISELNYTAVATILWGTSNIVAGRRVARSSAYDSVGLQRVTVVECTSKTGRES